MKKILIGALLLGWMAAPASAQGVKKMKHHKKSKANTTYTDHSLDIAYSPEWYAALNAERNDEEVSLSESRRPQSIRNRGAINTTYTLRNYTVYGHSSGRPRPSAYEGDDAPTYDGAAKNAYRNLRANNTSEPLPGNNGSK